MWNFQPLGAKARPMSVDFSDARDLKLYVNAYQKMTRPIVADLSLKGMSAREIHDNMVATRGPDTV
jgi:hypothetical protein